MFRARFPVVARLMLALLLLCGTVASRAAGLVVVDAWIAPGPPVVRVHAGYLRIDNPGATAMTITGAQSRRFARIEMHRNEMQNGMNSMRKEQAVEIPAGGTVEFAPGGLHLMLFDATSAPVLGETIPLTLLCADGGTIEVTATVRAPAAGDASHHEHHH